MTERRKGHGALRWDKASQSLKTFDPNPPLYYDGHQRPAGSNADEWHLFLSEHCCSRPNQVNGMTYMAVQIAEAIDAAAERQETLRKALQSLVNEVSGAWSAFDHDIRAAISNTNYACVQQKLDEAEAALGPSVSRADRGTGS